MQIDFHHAVTYVAARFAGFDHPRAEIIAYAAQYVDDATHDGFIRFDNGALYLRISSAHKTFNLLNLFNIENKLIWLPFHFLPGNGGAEAGQEVSGKFIEKIICRPGDGSAVARDMVDATLRERKKPNTLHRLGIMLHVYTDTWAHQGFAGVCHQINDVNDPEELGGPGLLGDILEDLGDLRDVATATVAPWVGHGKAGSLPDMPYLSWTYRNCRGETILRNNTADFCEAAQSMCKVLQRFRQEEDATVQITGIPDPEMKKIRDLFTRERHRSGWKRHAAWLEAIRQGVFAFGKADLTYDEAGPGSWKGLALGNGRDEKDLLREYVYTPQFLQSDWKRFHDALQEHRLSLFHDVLPSYGICAG